MSQTSKNDTPIQLGLVLNDTKFIFFHFLSAVSLGSRVSKTSEKFRLDCKIDFQNIIYTKCIHIIIDSFILVFQ